MANDPIPLPQNPQIITQERLWSRKGQIISLMEKLQLELQQINQQLNQIDGMQGQPPS